LGPDNKIHDLHPPISPTGLFWNILVPDSSVTIAPDRQTATLVLNDVAVIDEPNFPKPGPVNQGTMSLRIVWTVAGGMRMFNDASNHFAVQGFVSTAKAEFKVSVPALNFSWTSSPMETSHSTFAGMGNEVNGEFYDRGLLPAALPPETGNVPSGPPRTGGGGESHFVRRLGEG